MSDAFTLQEETTIDGQVGKSGKLAVKGKYINEIPTKKIWYR